MQKESTERSKESTEEIKKRSTEMKVKKMIRGKQRVKEGCLKKCEKLKGLIGTENPQLV